MALEIEFNVVSQAVLRAAKNQAAECESIAAIAPDRAPAFANHLRALYGAVCSHVELRRSRFKDRGDETWTDEMRTLLGKVHRLQRNLDWLRDGVSRPLDLGTTYYLEGIARTLVKDPVELTILVEGGEDAYSTLADPYGDAIAEWGFESAKDDPSVLLVFVPDRETDSQLLHPLIIHEIAHTAADANRVMPNIWKEFLGRKSWLEKFRKTTDSMISDGAALTRKDAESDLSTWLVSWIEESWCDAIATLLLGPSYLYSFMVEVAAGNLDIPTHEHPAPRQRIKGMLKLLDEMGWSDHMSSAHPEINSWLRDIAGEVVVQSDEFAYLSTAVNDLYALVRRSASDFVGDHLLSPAPGETTEIADLLAQGVPPAQSLAGNAFRPELIILACWDAAIGTSKEPRALIDAPETEDLSQLLSVALELSELTAAWNETWPS